METAACSVILFGSEAFFGITAACQKIMSENALQQHDLRNDLFVVTTTTQHDQNRQQKTDVCSRSGSFSDV